MVLLVVDDPTESGTGGCLQNNWKVGAVVTQNGNKQRANKSENRTTATTETKAARRARTRATTMRETIMTGRKSAVPLW
jgi:hypothetical protein